MTEAEAPAPAKKRRSRKAKKPTGRPRKEIDLKMFRTLSAAGCSIDEIAAMLRNSGCQIDRRTLMRRLKEAQYADVREEGILIRNATLRSVMFAQAQMMNSAGVNQSQYLANNWLGMSNKSSMELTGRNGGPISTVDLSNATDDQLTVLESIFGPLAVAGRDDGSHPRGESEAPAAEGA